MNEHKCMLANTFNTIDKAKTIKIPKHITSWAQNKENTPKKSNIFMAFCKNIFKGVAIRLTNFICYWFNIGNIYSNRMIENRKKIIGKTIDTPQAPQVMQPGLHVENKEPKQESFLSTLLYLIPGNTVNKQAKLTNKERHIATKQFSQKVR